MNIQLRSPSYAFFDPLLQRGEYIVIEDAGVTEMGEDARFDGGPARAVVEFMFVGGEITRSTPIIAIILAAMSQAIRTATYAERDAFHSRDVECRNQKFSLPYNETSNPK